MGVDVEVEGGGGGDEGGQVTEDLHVDWYAENQQLKAENARLRDALEPFADENNWETVYAEDRNEYAIAYMGADIPEPWKMPVAALATPAESAGPTDAEMLDWLGQSNSIMPADASDIVNGYRWRGKYCGSIRDAIRAAMKAEGK